MRKFCNVCCGLLLPVLVGAWVAGWRGLDLCGTPHYGPVALTLSAGALALSVAVTEYLLRCFGDDRGLLSLALFFWAVPLVPLLLGLAGIDFWLLGLLVLSPWLPLGALLPGDILAWLLAGISAVEAVRCYLARRRLPKKEPGEEEGR